MYDEKQISSDATGCSQGWSTVVLLSHCNWPQVMFYMQLCDVLSDSSAFNVGSVCCQSLVGLAQ